MKKREDSLDPMRELRSSDVEHDSTDVSAANYIYIADGNVLARQEVSQFIEFARAPDKVPLLG